MVLMKNRFKNGICDTNEVKKKCYNLIVIKKKFIIFIFIFITLALGLDEHKVFN